MLAQRAVSEEQEGSSQTILLARRTRTIQRCSFDARREGQSGCSPEGKVGKIERPSPGLMARPGKSIAKQSEGRAGEKYLPVGGRVRKLRAVEDQSAPIPEEITSELG